MKQKVTFAIALIAVAAISYAQDTQPEPKDWTFSIGTTAVSKYVGSTGGALFVDQACLQTCLMAFHKSGFYAGLWRSVPFDSRFLGTYANETDEIVGFSKDVGSWNLDFSTTVYDLVPVSDLYAVNLTATANTGKVRPYGVIEYDIAQSSRLMPGFIYKAGIRGGVTKIPLQWDLAALGNAGPSPYGGKSDVLSAYRLTLGWPIPFGVGTLTPGIMVQQRTGRSGGLTADQTVFQIKYSVSF